MNILALDDNKGFLDILSENLEHAGHTVYAASHYDDALRELDRDQTDLLLLDVIMPDTDGIEIAEQLSRKDRSYFIVGMSGGSERLSPALGLTAMKVLGVDAVLQKPFSIKTLMEKVSSLPPLQK